MDERKNTDAAGSEGAENKAIGPAAIPQQGSAPSVTPENPADRIGATPPKAESSKAAALNGLPDIDSPSISPATPESAGEDDLGPAAPIPGLPAIVPQPVAGPQFADTGTQAPRARFAIRPRHKRYAKLAASVAIGALLGAIGGSLLTGGLTKRPTQNVAALEENKAMQHSVARLAKEVTTLKANLDAARKATHTQVANIDKKLTERLKKESAEITGSISKPQTVEANAAPAGPAPTIAPAATTAPVAAAVPLPAPRPATRVAMAEPQQSQPQIPARLSIIQDWSIRDSRGGYIYVEGHGDIYQIVPGAPLPGLGPVESIKRLDGRWVVTTPKGIIVSMRDRRYFE